jgi:DNA mismatch endonuclease (patch repair protein)
MADVFTPRERSAVMRAVKSSNTTPELAVRRAAHGLGLRFRLGRTDLPGKPDLVFPSRKAALFVHGCFWHGHDCPRGARMPASNRDYWLAKIGRNVARDRKTLAALKQQGWKAHVIWECETRDKEKLARLLARKLKKGQRT